MLLVRFYHPSKFRALAYIDPGVDCPVRLGAWLAKWYIPPSPLHLGPKYAGTVMPQSTELTLFRIGQEMPEAVAMVALGPQVAVSNSKKECCIRH